MAVLDFLPVVGSALSSLWNTFTGQSQSKSLMKYQQKLNQQSIDIQNRYNSPIAQMERLQLREAGLNPNLVYGNGVDGNQSGSASVGISNRNPQANFDFAEAVNNVFKRRQLENETNIADASREKILADKMLSTARYLDTMQDVARKDATFGVFVDKAKADLAYTEQALEESKARTSKTYEEWNNLLLQRDKLTEEIRYMKAHATAEELQPGLIHAKITNLASSSGLNRSQKKVAESLARLNDKRIEELTARIKNIEKDTDLKSISYDIKKGMKDAGFGDISPKDILGFLTKLVVAIVSD